MSYWKEVKRNHEETEVDMDKNQFEDNIEKIIYIDAWKTEDDDEAGKVIAKVVKCKCKNVFVIYIDNLARHDAYAIEVIKEAVKDLKER